MLGIKDNPENFTSLLLVKLSMFQVNIVQLHKNLYILLYVAFSFINLLLENI
jgi:hypothetical protein